MGGKWCLATESTPSNGSNQGEQSGTNTSSTRIRVAYSLISSLRTAVCLSRSTYMQAYHFFPRHVSSSETKTVAPLPSFRVPVRNRSQVIECTMISQRRVLFSWLIRVFITVRTNCTKTCHSGASLAVFHGECMKWNGLTRRQSLRRTLSSVSGARRSG